MKRRINEKNENKLKTSFFVIFYLKKKQQQLNFYCRCCRRSRRLRLGRTPLVINV